MFPDYTLLVVRMYREKAASGTLSTRLSRPTPASIKKECLAVCAERFSKADEGILKTFFGQKSDKEGYLKGIQKTDLDKFRPLINFIKERTSTTSDSNVELLAWLIDFTPRPYQLGKNYGSAEDFGSEIPGNERIETIDEKELDNGQAYGGRNTDERSGITDLQLPLVKDLKGSKTIWPRKGVMFLLIGIICLGVLYALIPEKHKNQMELGITHTGCMYWADDHYEVSPCIQRGPDTIVVAIDQGRLKNFKRIDTSLINSTSIGKVWYRIKSHKYFFYSAPGKDPVEGINLRRLTDSSYAKFERTYRKSRL